MNVEFLGEYDFLAVAELGGYLGMTLGISLLDLEYFFKMINLRQFYNGRQ